MKGKEIRCIVQDGFVFGNSDLIVRYGVWVELRFLDLRLGMGFGDGQPWIRRESLGRK